MSILTFSNILSLLRLPLALLFIPENTSLRITVLALSAASDYFDGYIARRSDTVTKFGAILDPVMDKFFIFFVLGTLVYQNSLELWQLFSLISRDCFLVLFGCILLLRRGIQHWHFHAMSWGKLITVLQYAFLICLVLSVPMPVYIYYGFIALGAIYLTELMVREFRPKSSS